MTDFKSISDPSQVYGQCVPYVDSNEDTQQITCFCTQLVPNLIQQRHRWRNCTNGTSILEYEFYDIDQIAEPTVLQQQFNALQINKDIVYTNGTRTRFYYNGTVTYLKLDKSLDNVITPPSYLFYKWQDYDSTAATWNTKFSALNGNEDKTKYYQIRVFDNDTVWWYWRQCNTDGSIDTSFEISCGTAGDAETIKALNLQIDWYETQGTAFNGTRTVYATNGTVTKETWSYATVNGATTLTRTVNAILVPSPYGLFVAYSETSRPANQVYPSIWAYNTEIYTLKTYTVNSSAFYYFNKPTDYTGWAGFTDQRKEEIKNMGEYYAEAVYCAGVTSGTKACMSVQYRNGTKIRFKANAANTAWTQDIVQVAPTNLYYYVTETLSYQCNKTLAADNNKWKLDTAKTLTFNGYELFNNVSKLTTRYITTDVSKKWCWTDPTAATAGANDQSDFNYKKIVSMTYNKTEKTTTGSVVYFRNGTIANFGTSISQKSFISYKTAPDSYFSYYTVNSYQDGTYENVYYDFYTITKGPAVPACPTNDECPTVFNYNLIAKTGLIDSYENRTTGVKTANYRNGSVAVFTNGVFTSWTVAPDSYWVWCDKDDTPELYFDWVCTNGTTIRISEPIDAASIEPAIEFMRNTYFGYMEIFQNGTSKSFYLNGSAAWFNSTGFVSWIIVPDEFYVQKIIVTPAATDVEEVQSYSNGTIRTIRVEDSPDTDEITKAIGYEFIDTYTNGSQQIFYRNGSVAFFNATGFDHWVVPPTEFFVSYEKYIYDDGVEYIFSNGTDRMVAREIDITTDTEYYIKTSFEILDKFINGTTIVTYRNGTIAVFNDSGFQYYIAPPQSYYYSFDDGRYAYQFYNDSRLIMFYP